MCLKLKAPFRDTVDKIRMTTTAGPFSITVQPIHCRPWRSKLLSSTGSESRGSSPHVSVRKIPVRDGANYNQIPPESAEWLHSASHSAKARDGYKKGPFDFLWHDLNLRVPLGL